MSMQFETLMCGECGGKEFRLLVIGHGSPEEDSQSIHYPKDVVAVCVNPKCNAGITIKTTKPTLELHWGELPGLYQLAKEESNDQDH